MTTNLLSHTPSLAFLGSLGWPELLLLGFVGVLIFGKRLPEVGKSIGRGLIEFKKGLAGIEDEVDQAIEPVRRIERQTKAAATPARDTAAAEASG